MGEATVMPTPPVRLSKGSAEYVMASLQELNLEDNQERLHEAARRGDVSSVLRCLNAGADPNHKIKEYGWTPLHNAARDGRLEVAKVILDFGGDPNLRDETGQTALHRAVFHAHCPLIILFLSHNADPTLYDDMLQTPFSIAEQKLSQDEPAFLAIQKTVTMIEKKKADLRKRAENEEKKKRRTSLTPSLSNTSNTSHSIPNSVSFSGTQADTWINLINGIPEDEAVEFSATLPRHLPSNVVPVANHHQRHGSSLTDILTFRRRTKSSN